MTQFFSRTGNKLPTLSRSKPMPDLKDYITTEKAAAKMSVNLEYLRQMIRKKKIDAIKAGASWLVSKKAVDDYTKTTKGLAKNDPRRRKAQ